MSKNETIRTLKDFNSHLRNEIHELKDKLKAEEQKSQGFFKDMIEAELKCDSLNDVIEKLQAENAALKLKSSIFTEPSKRETELERQLESERMRADELSEHLETLRNQYREMYNDCHIFINENSSLKKELEKFEKMKQEDANS